VSFHGGLAARAPAEPGAVKASVLVCTGVADPFVTREHREGFEDEMTRARPDWQMHVYANAMHGFTERVADRPGARYDPRADRRSWSAMRDLFDEAFALPPCSDDAAI
jgi:dienelactone hydrolase